MVRHAQTKLNATFYERSFKNSPDAETCTLTGFAFWKTVMMTRTLSFVSRLVLLVCIKLVTAVDDVDKDFPSVENASSLQA